MGEEYMKKTRETLGKIIRKPPLTDKLLAKPPFRFLHDIFTEVIKTTGFLDGLLTSAEMDSKNVSVKDDKIAFLQKIVDVVSIVIGDQLSVRPTKIVAGHEPDKTNELLQAIARCIRKNLSSDDAVQQVLSKKSPKIQEKPPAGSSKKREGKENREQNEDPRKKRREKDGEKDRDRSSDRHRRSAGKERSRKKGSSREQGEGIEDRREEHSSEKPRERNERNKEEKSREKREDKKERRNSRTKLKDSAEVRRRPSQDLKSPVKGQKSPARGKQRPSEAKSKKPPLDNREEEKTRKKTQPRKDEEENGDSDQDRRMRERNREDDDESRHRAEQNERQGEEEGGEGSPAAGSSRPPRPASAKGHRRRPVPDRGSRGGAPDGQDDTSKERLRGRPARPPSARPAAPRVRQRPDPAEEEIARMESAGKQRTAPIIVDRGQRPQGEGISSDEDEDDQFLVQEEEIQPPEMDKLSPIPNGEVNGDAEEQETEHGGLVRKILETKKEIETSAAKGANLPGKGRVEIERAPVNEVQRRKERELVMRDIEKLRGSVQKLCRSAVPLGKIIDYIQEDMDSMQNELIQWRKENKKHAAILKEEEGITTKTIEPLQAELDELDRSITAQLDMIAASKCNVLRNQEKIDKMVAGVTARS